MRNSERRAALAAIIAVCVGLAMSSAVAGDRNGSKEREAAHRMQIMQMQFSEEKAALEKDKNDLTQKVDDLTKQAESTKQGADQAERKRAALAKELTAAKTELTAAKAEVTSLQEKLHQLKTAHAGLIALNKQDLEKYQKQIALAQNAVAQRGQALGTCEQKNAKLYQLNREILTRYRDKGVLDAITQADPLTGIQSVRMENILEEYRDKLDAQRIEGAK